MKAQKLTPRAVWPEPKPLGPPPAPTGGLNPRIVAELLKAAPAPTHAPMEWWRARNDPDARWISEQTINREPRHDPTEAA